MKQFLILFILLAFLFVDSAQAQKWVQDHLASDGYENSNNLVSYFHSEMKKEIGEKLPNLSFTPINKAKPIAS